MAEPSPTLARIKGKIGSSGHRAHDVAKMLDCHPSTLSRIVNGRSPLPDRFETDLDRVLDLLDRAERARQRVLDGNYSDAST